MRVSPATATVAAKRAAKPARKPGLDVASRRGISQPSQQPARTRSPTRATRGAWAPKCSRAGIEIDPGGIAPACPPAASSRSPNSSDQDASRYVPSGFLLQLKPGPDVGPRLPQLARRLLHACGRRHVVTRVMNAHRFISKSCPDALGGSAGNLLAQVPAVRCPLWVKPENTHRE